MSYPQQPPPYGYQPPPGYPQQPPMGYPQGYPQQPPVAYPPQPYKQQPAGRQQPQIVRNRQQTGHSIIKHLFLGIFVLWIPTIYYAVSPNHYFHM
ncbi:hypothetical protein AB0H71_29740 [Nocardia sp. NPDC050697]|uniref:hypothetical protein n=1 Tax=Nocardia sp. NPDC050697 TaxID=3155158 RepID=UPI00340BFCC1